MCARPDLLLARCGEPIAPTGECETVTVDCGGKAGEYVVLRGRGVMNVVEVQPPPHWTPSMQLAALWEGSSADKEISDSRSECVTDLRRATRS